MLVKAHLAAAAIARLDPAIRLYVFGGPDESGARALRDRVGEAVGRGAERVDVSVARLQDVPSLLADEAASISLFGGPRWISIHSDKAGGDDVLPGIENLLNAPVAGTPVVATIAGLTGKSRLAKLAEKDARAIVVICYPPDARDMGRMADTIARSLGLSMDSAVSSAIADACGGDSGLMAREVEKLALYCDADPAQGARATLADWQAIGANVDSAELGAVINAAFGGALASLPACVAELDAAGALDIRLVRAMMNRAHLLARLRVAVEQGRKPAEVVAAQGKAVFWKEKDAVTQQLGRWTAPTLARAIDHLHSLERALKAPDNAGPLLVKSLLLQFARLAATRRAPQPAR